MYKLDPKFPMHPQCYAHDFGRLVLSAIAHGIHGQVKPNEAQLTQMGNVDQMKDLPVVMQIGIIQKVALKDEVMSFILTRCKSFLPDAHVEPRMLMYARLMVGTVDEAMVLCAMIYAMQLDLNILNELHGTELELTYDYFKEQTQGNVLDSDAFGVLLDSQKAVLEVPGLDEHRLNHKHSYSIDIEA